MSDLADKIGAPEGCEENHGAVVPTDALLQARDELIQSLTGAYLPDRDPVSVNRRIAAVLDRELRTDGDGCVAEEFEPQTRSYEGDGERDECYFVPAGQGEGIEVWKEAEHAEGGATRMLLLKVGAEEAKEAGLYGEISLFTRNNQRTATVLLTKRTRIVRITCARLIKILRRHPDLLQDITWIATHRLDDTIQHVQDQAIQHVLKAEARRREVSSAAERKRMQEVFNFGTARTALERDGAGGQVGMFTLTGTNGNGARKEQLFLARVFPLERDATGAPQEPRWALVRKIFGIDDGPRQGSGPRPMVSDGIVIKIHAGPDAVAPVTQIAYSAQGGAACVEKGEAGRFGFDGYGFVEQIHGVAFAGCSRIETRIQEQRALQYVREHGGEPTAFAPSRWSACCPSIPTYPGFVSSHSPDEAIAPKCVLVLAYPIDAEADRILIVLRHVERSLMPQDDAVDAGSHPGRVGIAKLDESTEIRTALVWAANALDDLLRKRGGTLRPEVMAAMAMQRKRNQELLSSCGHLGSLG